MATSPNPFAVRVRRSGSSAFKCAIAEAQGSRPTHEDDHSERCGEEAGDFWVLDGHRGSSAAKFGAVALAEAQELGQSVEKNKKMPSDAAVQQGFRAVDNKLRQHFKQNPKDEIGSGSTVTGALCLRLSDGFYSAKMVNCGDSRGVVVRAPEMEKDQDKDGCGNVSKTATILETKDHKPDDRAEKKRIEEAGGKVIGNAKKGVCPRIDGKIAVSRGLGDFDFKADKKRSPAEQKISCVPDVYEASNLPAGTLLLLACDGLWDVMSTEVAASFVRACLRNDPHADLAVIATELVHLSLQSDCDDNVTVLLVQFSDGSTWKNAKEETFYPEKLGGRGGRPGRIYHEEDENNKESRDEIKCESKCKIKSESKDKKDKKDKKEKKDKK